MKRAASRSAESGRRASATAFLAGVLVGAVLAGAAVVLLSSADVVLRAAAMLPLTGALVLAGMMAVAAVRGDPPERDAGPGDADEDGEPGDRESAEGRTPAEGEPERAGTDGGEKRNRPPVRTDTERVAASDPAGAEDAAREESGEDPAAETVVPEDAPEREPDPEPSPEEIAPPEPSPHDATPPEPATGGPAAPGPSHNTLGLDGDRPVIDAWRRYRRDGDGFFTARGLERQLDSLGFRAEVREGSAVDAAGDVLVVEAGGPDTGHFFVVPSFMKSPGAAPQWFEDASGGTLSARTRTIHRLAEGKWTDTSFAVVRKGRIE